MARFAVAIASLLLRLVISQTQLKTAARSRSIGSTSFRSVRLSTLQDRERQRHYKRAISARLLGM